MRQTYPPMFSTTNKTGRHVITTRANTLDEILKINEGFRQLQISAKLLALLADCLLDEITLSTQERGGHWHPGYFAPNGARIDLGVYRDDRVVQYFPKRLDGFFDPRYHDPKDTAPADMDVINEFQSTFHKRNGLSMPATVWDRMLGSASMKPINTKNAIHGWLWNYQKGAKKYRY